MYGSMKFWRDDDGYKLRSRKQEIKYPREKQKWLIIHLAEEQRICVAYDNTPDNEKGTEHRVFTNQANGKAKILYFIIDTTDL